MNILLFEKLHADGLLNEPCLQKIKSAPQNNNFSLHWEIKTILYVGVLLLTSGISLLVYKNIDSIGHLAILLFIASICVGSFYYCLKNKLPFSLQKVASPNSFFDYILLLGTLSFLIFLGYLQFKYSVFGNRFGLATFIPMVVLFFIAYYADQLSILSLAITNLAAWVGLAITPIKILRDNDFNSDHLIISALLLGGVLIAAGIVSKRRNVKAHFEFTYTNFGAHIFYIACIAAMFNFEIPSVVWLVLMAGISYLFYLKALKEKAFYFLLTLTLYLYFGLSVVIIKLMLYSSIESISLGLIYLIFSAIGLVVLLLEMNKKIKSL